MPFLGKREPKIETPAYNLELNLTSQEVRYGSKTQRLTAYEYQVLWLLKRQLDCFVSVKEIIKFLYADDTDGGPIMANDNVAQFIVRLRRKLKKLDSGYQIFVRHQFGYKLSKEHDAFARQIGKEEEIGIPKRM